MFYDKNNTCQNRPHFSCNIEDGEPGCSGCVRVSEEHHVQVARRRAVKQTELLGMSTLETHYVATAVSEMASNQFFHTGGGGVIHFFISKKMAGPALRSLPVMMVPALPLLIQR